MSWGMHTFLCRKLLLLLIVAHWTVSEILLALRPRHICIPPWLYSYRGPLLLHIIHISWHLL
jgi:hypothetical protein